MSILTGLQTRLMERLAEGDAFWTGTITVNGETQQAGKKFETLIESCLREMGQTFGRAPSQQP